MSVYKLKGLIKNDKMPMKHFTTEDVQPSKRTLDLIRTIAYTYRVMNLNGRMTAYCLN